MLKAIKHQLSLFSYSWHAVGFGRMLASSVRWANDGDARNVDSGFDATYGTDTNTELTPSEAQLPRQRQGTATMYLPTMDADLEALLDALCWSERLIREATFVDIGSGKGRAVFLAAMRGFREAIGVELSPVLHRVANDNLAKVRTAGVLRSPVRFVLDDATTVQVPEGPLVVYLYHPFREEVAFEVVARIVAAVAERPRPAAILYCHPTLQKRFAAEVFTQGDMFDIAAEGERRTRHFSVGWTVATNRGWLRTQPCRPSTGSSPARP